MDDTVDPRTAEMLRALQALRKLVAHQRLLDIADRTKTIESALTVDGDGKGLGSSTISDLLNGKFRKGSRPQLSLLVNALLDLADHERVAEDLGHRVLTLWDEIHSPAIRWSPGGAQHFAQHEWEWGAANVYPDTPGSRSAFAITCMDSTQRPVRPEVFTETMRSAALTAIDWGPLRRHGGFEEHATLTDTGFRVWGTIEGSYGYPRRLVSIGLSAFGAATCYWFGDTVLTDENWTVELAALSTLVALHALLGSRGLASACEVTQGGSRVRQLTIPRVSPDADFTGYGWPERVVREVDRTVAESTEHTGPDSGDADATHPREALLQNFAGGKISSGPLPLYGRQLRKYRPQA